jgi:hypothetical protein
MFIARKALTTFFRGLNKVRQRGMATEYTLIALITVFVAFQVGSLLAQT